MSDTDGLGDFLAGAHIDDAVFALRPDYRAVLIAVDGLVPGPSDHDSDALLRTADSAARRALSAQPVDQLPISPPGEMRTGPWAPSRSAPATAWRRCGAVRRPDYRG
jgi:hypothetical protein